LKRLPQSDPMTQPTPIRNLSCPLCGGANACAPAQCGSFDTACWCQTASFDPALLAAVPEAARGLACICARCAATSISAVLPQPN